MLLTGNPVVSMGDVTKKWLHINIHHLSLLILMINQLILCTFIECVYNIKHMYLKK